MENLVRWSALVPSWQQMKLEIWCGWAHPYKTIAKFIVHSILYSSNKVMLSKMINWLWQVSRLKILPNVLQHAVKNSFGKMFWIIIKSCHLELNSDKWLQTLKIFLYHKKEPLQASPFIRDHLLPITFLGHLGENFYKLQDFFSFLKQTWGE